MNRWLARAGAGALANLAWLPAAWAEGAADLVPEASEVAVAETDSGLPPLLPGMGNETLLFLILVAVIVGGLLWIWAKGRALGAERAAVALRHGGANRPAPRPAEPAVAEGGDEGNAAPKGDVKDLFADRLRTN